MGITNYAGFDNEKYLKEQTASILERVNRISRKLYLEFGGKIARLQDQTIGYGKLSQKADRGG
jgi:uncharacterized protein (UPF0371 family)